jgi:predicted nucleic acid-binding protein
MKVVVDSNIVFSAILNTASNIGQILIVGSKYFDFYSINLLKSEILKHKSKIKKITGFSEERFERTYNLINSKIRFTDEMLISNTIIEKAYKLAKDIDVDDTLFVALAEQMKSKLWTGDKELIRGLERKGSNRFISTLDLYEIYIKKELEKKKLR